MHSGRSNSSVEVSAFFHTEKIWTFKTDHLGKSSIRRTARNQKEKHRRSFERDCEESQERKQVQYP